MGRYRRIDRSEKILSRSDTEKESPQSLLNDISQNNGNSRPDNCTNTTNDRPKHGRKRKIRMKKKKKTQLAAFNPNDQKRIEAYLIEYRDGALQACLSASSSSNAATTKKVNEKKRRLSEPDEVTVRISNKKDWYHEHQVITIAGHDFRKLTNELLTHPYLELPATLANKERKFIYESCIHVGLFHTGAGSKNDYTRRAIVSIYPDGLDYAPDLEIPSILPVRRCKPWFYRNDLHLKRHPSSLPLTLTSTSPPPLATKSDDSSDVISICRHIVREATNEAKKSIQELANYPGDCLRGIDSMDEYDSSGLISNPKNIENISDTPQMSINNKIIFVDSSTKMKECALTLLRSVHNNTLTEVAFDLEAHNPSKYQQTTCLIQLCTNTGLEYMIDVLAKDDGVDDKDDGNGLCVWDNVNLLRPIFANPNVVKIGHGITGIDVPCLHRDFGIFIVNCFDTFEAANVLELKGYLSLAKLCDYYGLVDNNCDEDKMYAKLKEKYQNADWRVRPLKKDMIEYGLHDVRYLIQLRRFLMRDLAGGERSCNNTSHMVGDELAMTLSCRTSNTIVSGIESSCNGEMEDEREVENKEGRVMLDHDNDNEDGYFTPDEMSGKSGDITSQVDFSAINGEVISEHPLSPQAVVIPHPPSAGSSSFLALYKHEKLTKVLRISQERCLGFWIPKTEPTGKNDILTKFIMRADRLTCGNTRPTNSKIWTQSDMTLYSDLISWRNDVAKKEGVMPTVVCSLDLLVLMAYKRPVCRIGLKRLSYYTPELLREGNQPDYLDDAFSIVFLASVSRVEKEGIDSMSGVAEDDVKLYEDLTFPAFKNEISTEMKQTRSLYEAQKFSLSSSKKKSMLIYLKWTTIGAAVVTFWVSVLSRRRR